MPVDGISSRPVRLCGLFLRRARAGAPTSGNADVQPLSASTLVGAPSLGDGLLGLPLAFGRSSAPGSLPAGLLGPPACGLPGGDDLAVMSSAASQLARGRTVAVLPNGGGRVWALKDVTGLGIW